MPRLVPPGFWFELLHSPDFVFSYTEEERDIYERTKEKLIRTLKKGNIFIIRCDDSNRVIRIWRKPNS